MKKKFYYDAEKSPVNRILLLEGKLLDLEFEKFYFSEAEQMNATETEVKNASSKIDKSAANKIGERIGGQDMKTIATFDIMGKLSRELVNYAGSEEGAKKVSMYTKIVLFAYVLCRLPSDFIQEKIVKKIPIPGVEFFYMLFIAPYLGVYFTSIFRALTPKAFTEFIKGIFGFCFKCIPTTIFNAIIWGFKFLKWILTLGGKLIKPTEAKENFYRTAGYEYHTENFITAPIKKLFIFGFKQFFGVLSVLLKGLSALLTPIDKCIKENFGAYGMSIMFAFSQILPHYSTSGELVNPLDKSGDPSSAKSAFPGAFSDILKMTPAKALAMTISPEMAATLNASIFAHIIGTCFFWCSMISMYSLFITLGGFAAGMGSTILGFFGEVDNMSVAAKSPASPQPTDTSKSGGEKKQEKGKRPSGPAVTNAESTAISSAVV